MNHQSKRKYLSRERRVRLSKLKSYVFKFTQSGNFSLVGELLETKCVYDIHYDIYIYISMAANYVIRVTSKCATDSLQKQQHKAQMLNQHFFHCPCYYTVLQVIFLEILWSSAKIQQLQHLVRQLLLNNLLLNRRIQKFVPLNQHVDKHFPISLAQCIHPTGMIWNFKRRIRS